LYQSPPITIHALDNAAWRLFFGSGAPLPAGTYWQYTTGTVEMSMYFEYVPFQ
jgi:hypothetical protein